MLHTVVGRMRTHCNKLANGTNSNGKMENNN